VSITPGDPVTMPEVLAEIVKNPAFDFIAADAEEDPPFGKDFFIEHLSENMEGYIKIRKEYDKPFLIVFDERSPGIDDMDSYIHRTRAELRTMLVKDGLPFFPSVEEAARAANELITYYQRREEAAS
jgi:hypothetical protein